MITRRATFQDLADRVAELQAQLDAVRDLEPDFADIAVGKTVKVLMYDDVQEALQGDIETELKSGDQRVQIEIPDEINEELEAQLDAVRPYLSHHRNCPMWRMAKGSDLCSCGLSAALQGEKE